MHACNAAARRNARAKKVLLAAIGIAGCTGGPKLASTTSEAPSALVQPSEATQQAEPQSSRAFLAGVTSGGAQSIWGRRTASSPATPRDPFLANRSGGFQTSSATRPTPTRAVASRMQRPHHGLVQPVGFEETDAYCSTPAGVTIQPREEAPGVVRIIDHRLPPAKPLGASNPFDQRSAGAKPRIQATPTNRIAAKPATNTGVQIKPIERNAAPTLPVQTYLATRVTTGGTPANTVRHEDMIVDTAILPKRRDWRAATLPATSQSSEQFAITARPSFATPEWDGTKPNPAASANLPIEISPAAAFDRPSAAMQLAKRSEIPAASDITPPATVPDPFELPADPFSASELADAPAFDATASDEPLDGRRSSAAGAWFGRIVCPRGERRFQDGRGTGDGTGSAGRHRAIGSGRRGTESRRRRRARATGPGERICCRRSRSATENSRYAGRDRYRLGDRGFRSRVHPEAVRLRSIGKLRNRSSTANGVC